MPGRGSCAAPAPPSRPWTCSACPPGWPERGGCARQSRSGTSADAHRRWRRTGSPRATPTPGAGARPGDAAPSHRQAEPASASGELVAAALRPQQAVGHAPAPADVLSRDLPEASAQLGLRDADDLAAMALGTAVLAHHAAGEPLRNPEQGAQCLNGSAGAAPGSEVYLRQLPPLRRSLRPERRLLQFGFCQKLIEAGVILLHLG